MFGFIKVKNKGKKKKLKDLKFMLVGFGIILVILNNDVIILSEDYINWNLDFVGFFVVFDYFW